VYNKLHTSELRIDPARTKKRPLPSGRISVLAATIYLLIQYATGIIFFLATLQGIALVRLVPHSDKEADEYALEPAFMSLHSSYFHCKVTFTSMNMTWSNLISFAIYPLVKRFTHWPQAWLGFAMNFGFMTAWTATTGDIDGKLLGVAMAACWW